MGASSFAQQEPQFTHNMFNNMYYNPAFAGSGEAICFTGIARQQWMGIKEDGNNVAPRTMLISMDAPINILHGGIGGSICKDQLGYYSSIGVRLEYAYRFNFGEGIMSIGGQYSMLNSTYDFAKFKPIDDGDPVLADNSKQNNFMGDFGFGVFYKMPGKFFLGLSAINLSEAKAPIGKANLQLKRNYYLAGGYEYTLPSYPEFELLPSFLVKTDATSAQYDLNTLVRYNNKFWGGVTYRVQDAVGLLVGMNVKNFRIGYSYDITTSKLHQAGSMGSHEVMLGYCFKIVIEKPRKSYRNTRFL
jgi:type IX secretion system PorP/SprF family membrane protein